MDRENAEFDAALRNEKRRAAYRKVTLETLALHKKTTARKFTDRKKWITKTICGRVLCLRAGKTYVACAPLAAFGVRQRYAPPITVSIMYRDACFGAMPEATVDNLTQEGAREFLRAFNNGRISFVGRKWTTK